MAAANRPAPVSRIFLLDKPAGISSFSALGALKRTLGTRKVGHAGTLDPFATGMLIAASGKLTRAVSLLADMDKEYIAVFRFGCETDTLDPEGEVTAEAGTPDFDAIEKARKNFLGEIKQIPPAYSAVKIAGRRAYARARDGQDPEMPERTVRIDEFEILKWNEPDLMVRIRCSKGTYIRSIARDLGRAAESRAYCLSLRRTAIGPFRVETAVEPAKAGPEDGTAAPEFFRCIGTPVCGVSAEVAAAMRSGVPPQRINGFHPVDEPLALYVDPKGCPAALLEGGAAGGSYRIVFDS